MASVLIVGATGATGSLLVEQLLSSGHEVRVVVRSAHKFSSLIINNPNMKVVEANILDLTDDELVNQVDGYDAVVSCLGHVLSFSGMYGHPRALCTEATRRLCNAIAVNTPSKPTKFILMNTVGVSNPELNEKRKWFERALLKTLRHTIPPHRDNETAAEHLMLSIGKQNKSVEWCCVRPDTLINAEISLYETSNSPITGIFTGRPTSRANVAHFMMELIVDATLWDTWKFKTPVIMNSK